MSLCQQYIVDKHCFIQCPPERCNCKNGNPLEWKLQQARLGLPVEDEPTDAAAIASKLSESAPGQMP